MSSLPATSTFRPGRHIPPLLLASTITIGGLFPFLRGPEASLLKFGFPASIATSRAAHPVITAFSSRVTSMGLALWGMYLGGQYRAMDVLLASFGWMAVVDAYVCWKEGQSGAAVFRGVTTGAVALWGLAGMTNRGCR